MPEVKMPAKEIKNLFMTYPKGYLDREELHIKIALNFRVKGQY